MSPGGRSRALAACLLAATLGAAGALWAQALPSQRALARAAEMAAAEHRWADAREAGAALAAGATIYDPDLVTGLTIQAEAAARQSDGEAALPMATRLGELGYGGGLLDRLHPILMKRNNVMLLLRLHAAAAAPEASCRLMEVKPTDQRLIRRWERARAAYCEAASP